jgi:hypothetical protein
MDQKSQPMLNETSQTQQINEIITHVEAQRVQTKK